MTDHYSVQLEWADGFHVSFLQSWVAPADDRFTGITHQVMGRPAGSTSARARSPSATGPAPARRSTPATRPTPGSPCQAFLDAIRAGEPGRPPLTLADARDATLTGLLVRKAVDERRVVTIDEIRAESAWSAASG